MESIFTTSLSPTSDNSFHTPRKTKTPTLQQCGMIYHVKYKDCDHDYVGEMARALGTILKEHQASSAVMNIALQQVIPSHLIT